MTDTAVAEPEAVETEKPKAKKVKSMHPCGCRQFAFVVDGENITTGCTGETAAKFVPGHDAKLKSHLIRAGVAGVSVTATAEDGSTTTLSPVEAAAEYGFSLHVEKGIENSIARETLRVKNAAAREAKKAATAAAAQKKKDDAKAAKSAAAEAAKAAESEAVEA